MWGKPSALSWRAGKFSSMHLISCRQSTSGFTALTKRRTRSSRSLTELMFQVARRKRIEAKDRCVRGEKQRAPWPRPHFPDDAARRAANKEEAPETGGLGASPVPYGGNLWREREIPPLQPK